MPVRVLVALAVMSLALALLVIVVVRVNRVALPWSMRRQLYGDQKLVTWAGPRTNYSATAWDAVVRAEAYYTGWWAGLMLLFAGLGIAAVLVAIGLGGGLRTLLASFVWLGVDALACVFVFATDIAYLVATVRTRAEWGAPSYREPERRSARDFVSPICWVVWLAIVALVAGVYVVFALAGPPVPMSALGYARAWSRLQIGEVSLLASLFALLLAGFSAQWVATLNAVEGEAADLLAAMNDIHRAQAIGMIIGMPIMMSVMTLFFLIPGFSANNVSVAIAFLALTPYFARVGASRGRLGGRITGWWWAPIPMRAETEVGG